MNAITTPRVSWVPLVVVAITQALLAFNIIALKISIDAIVTSYNAPASIVKTAIIAYSLAVASCIMAGAKLVPRFGSRRVFRVTIALFACAMFAVVLSTKAPMLVIAQLLAGIAAAVLVPASVVLIADNYADEQRTRALGRLSITRSLSLPPAFLLAGMLATWSSWRAAFVIMLVLAGIAYVLGDRLNTTTARVDLHVDVIGLFLTLVSVALIGIGVDNLTQWGVRYPRPEAPFTVFGISPAPIAIVLGALLLKAIHLWSRRCRATGRSVLIPPEFFGEPRERVALFSIFTIGTVSAAVTFLIPLYIEIVQGRNSLHTALAMIPFTLSSVAAAVLIGRVRAEKYLRAIARYGFLIVAAGLAFLGSAIHNDWSDFAVILSMSIAGLGEGALATLLLRLLVTDAPQECRSEADPMSTAASHLAAAVGTALAGALVIALLGATVQRDLKVNPEVAASLRAHLNLDRVAFVSNDLLRQRLEDALATPEQVSEAIRINTQARLRALKASFFALAGLALIAFIPNVRIPARSSVGNDRATDAGRA